MRTLLAAALLVMLASHSEAAFSVSATTTGSGTLQINGVAVDDVTVDTVFEGSGALMDDMPIDVPAPGQVSEFTEFSSYMFNVSKSPVNSTALGYTLTITFDQPILGIQFASGKLATGYSLLDASPSFDAIQPIGAFNTGSGGDSITIDGNTITIATGLVSTGTDPFRILTAVPEMSTNLSWSALAGIGCVLYRRRKQA
ncbi:hypothetical protein [Aeoliella mucimassa]|uniref:PEP-CTERM protein-sorting domain-containing protein n=1 Tax=Aeoliella mucimassa TaxID=2527972 RepID=A0A518AK15_9BACT|nr:hypothetical protein [Aeoliella mucimassa]QDU55073.1 hypothetical protein Pan181_12590 [Aeoliella mucimassa]